jgi:hypothetical protein
MNMQNLLYKLSKWRRCDAEVDERGYISPSATSVDVVHYLLFHARNSIVTRISAVLYDQCGGIFVHFDANDNYVHTFHVSMDGRLNHQVRDIEGILLSQEYKYEDNTLNFGNDNYKFLEDYEVKQWLS